ncbi:MAG TPA: hypothetical protein PK171_04855, partial [Atribacter sp.]|nr:hypothetical protein [Atribacter sp.]
MAIRIGCDPEFAVIDNHDSYIRFTYHKNLDCGFVKDDHCGAVGELNPNSSTNPAEVVENLRTLIKEIKREYPTLRVIGGGGAKYRISTGGHIHLSGLTNLDFQGYENYSWHRRSTRNHIRPTTKGNKLVLALDAFIARPMQRLQNGKRADKSYNLLSKIKIKSYSNGSDGFEYRSTPSWLTSPKV